MKKFIYLMMMIFGLTIISCTMPTDINFDELNINKPTETENSETNKEEKEKETTPKTDDTTPTQQPHVEHIHTYSNEYEYDENNHWNKVTCEHTTEKPNLGVHDFDDGVITTEPTETIEGIKTYTCKVCEYKKTESIGILGHTHTYSNEWSKDSTNHWKLSTCGHDVKTDIGVHDFTTYTRPSMDLTRTITTYTCKICGYNYDTSVNNKPTIAFASTETSLDYDDTIVINRDIDSVIYYTTNGTTPTNRSTIYSEPIKVKGDMNIKAIAYNGDITSDVISLSVTMKLYKIEYVSDVETIIGIPETEYLHKGESYDVASARIAKEGYDFQYWTVDGKEYHGRHYAKSDVTIVASWIPWKLPYDSISIIPSNYKACYGEFYQTLVGNKYEDRQQFEFTENGRDYKLKLNEPSKTDNGLYIYGKLYINGSYRYDFELNGRWGAHSFLVKEKNGGRRVELFTAYHAYNANWDMGIFYYNPSDFNFD